MSRLLGLNQRRGSLLFVFGLLFGWLLVEAIPIETDSQTRVEVAATGTQHPESLGSAVWVIGMICEADPTCFQRVELGPGWERTDEGIFATGPEAGTLSWTGKSRGGVVEVVFSAGPHVGIAEARVDGETRRVDLYQPEPGEVVVGLDIDPAGLDRVLLKVALVVAFGLACGVLAAWMVTRPDPTPGRPVGRWVWLALAAPPLGVWTIYLLALWPGVLSPDSMFQWSQVLTGRFDNWHPAFHGMTEWLISLPARTPASVAVAQIVALAGVVGWGLASMRRIGLHVAAAWMISLVFALWPSNGALVVTLWKDIPYAITVLALGVVLLREVDGRYPLLDRISGQALVGLLAALAALFHHAGPVVAVGSLVALALARSWRAVLAPTIGALVMFLLVQGPLFDALEVTTRSPPHDDAAVMHHLAAHMTAGTHLEPEQAEFVASNPYLSDTSWYLCDTVTPLITRPDFSVARLEEDAAESRRLLLSLFARNPRVDLIHMACSSQLVWKIRRLPGDYHFGAGFRQLDDGSLSTVVDNPHGLHRDPVIPSLTKPLAETVLATEQPGTAWLWWRAPLMVYALLFGSVVAAVRSGRRRYLLVAMPAGVLALTLVLAAPAQDFRYAYPVFVSGLLLAPYLALYVPKR